MKKQAIRKEITSITLSYLSTASGVILMFSPPFSCSHTQSINSHASDSRRLREVVFIISTAKLNSKQYSI